jgi:hypothetical protein
MQKHGFDLRQTLSDVLDTVTLDNHAFRNLPPNFACRNTGARSEAPFLSSPQLSSIAMGVSGLLPIPGTANLLRSSAAWNDSDDILMAAVLEAERRRLGDLRVALIGKHQMDALEAQKRHALLILQQQQQEATYLSNLSFLRSVQPMQTVPPQVEFYQADQHADCSTKVFTVLGSSLRGKKDLYIDVSELPVIAGQERQTIRGGVAEPFPQRLYYMLQDVEKQGKSHIVSFSPHGRAFSIHDMKAFTDEILPQYFAKQSKLVSFVRQIHLYGFARIHSGPDTGGHYHELFLNGRPELCTYMRRAGASKGKEDRRKLKDRHTPTIQPDFYTIGPIGTGQPPSAP